jgi:outer membrane protein TolC
MQDVEEAKASKLPQSSLTGSLSPALSTDRSSTSAVTTNSSQLQARAGLNIGQTLYDGGRSDRLIDWRRQQAEAARLGMLSTQEQITLTTTSLAFERSRFRMQAVIYAQNVRKMGCLVEALETIAGADKGRTSELVQARKQLQQAELLQVQAQSQARQIEAKLRRIVGDGLPGTEGMSTLLLTVPELPAVLTAAERATDITQLDANAAALREIARVVEAGNRPLVSWNVGASALVAAGGGSPRNAGLNAGVSVSIPLLNPAIEYSTQAARKRAEAALQQRAEALEQRRQRIVEVHEQAGSAFDRLRRIGLVLRDSDRLRNFTLQQWQQLGRRSLFDVIAAESDHYNLRVQYVNALHDGQQMNATLTSLGTGLTSWLQ